MPAHMPNTKQLLPVETRLSYSPLPASACVTFCININLGCTSREVEPLNDLHQPWCLRFTDWQDLRQAGCIVPVASSVTTCVVVCMPQ